MTRAADIVSAKSVALFDLFHTLTALESVWGPDRIMTHQILGVSQREWHEQLLDKSRIRLIGQERDPFAVVALMARAIDPSVPDAKIREAVESRTARFAGALLNVPQETQDVLRALKSRGMKLGLISNADVMEIEAWPRSPIAPLFDAVVLSCVEGCMKPEREIYDIALRRLGVGPASCVFVGDGGSHELEGARALGIATIMITGIVQEIWPERIPDRRRHADAEIARLNELIPD
jgi:putative hydrolase of the HAD superfamily